MKEKLVEMLQPGIEALAVGIDARIEAALEPEPTVEVLGSIRELAQRKHWFNEGPGRLDI